MLLEPIDITAASQKLKDHVRPFESVSFLSHMNYFLNTHLRTPNKMLRLTSVMMQMKYLCALYLSTGAKGTRIFDPATGNFQMIEELLNRIEDGYRYNFLHDYENLNFENFPIEPEVCNTTFLNYFVNGPMNYIEQERDRIEKVFAPFDDFIVSQTELSVEDFLDFCYVTERMETIRMNTGLQKMYGSEGAALLITEQKEKTSESFHRLVDHVESAIYNVCLHREDLLFAFPEKKVDAFLKIFVSAPLESDFLYYTAENPLTNRPLIRVREDLYVFFAQKQLMTAVYNFLTAVCSQADKDGLRIQKRKDRQLEEKTKEVFLDFFEECQVYENYFIGEKEKDLLILYRGAAFIIEAKAHSYREPFRDIDKGFIRIKNDFDDCIQEGFDQAADMHRMFRSGQPFEIFDAKGRVVASINPRRYHDVHSIIVTASRFGHVQCNLGLLLEIEDEDPYPWSVYIDDLETFLITLKRKPNPFGELLSFLRSRQQFHGRMNVFDELDICADFILHKDSFLRVANSDMYYYPPTTLQSFFDALYYLGLGFKNELHLDEKLDHHDEETEMIIRKLKLTTPKVVKDYLKTR